MKPPSKRAWLRSYRRQAIKNREAATTDKGREEWQKEVAWAEQEMRRAGMTVQEGT